MDGITGPGGPPGNSKGLADTSKDGVMDLRHHADQKPVHDVKVFELRKDRRADVSVVALAATAACHGQRLLLELPTRFRVGPQRP